MQKRTENRHFAPPQSVAIALGALRIGQNGNCGQNGTNTAGRAGSGGDRDAGRRWDLVPNRTVAPAGERDKRSARQAREASPPGAPDAGPEIFRIGGLKFGTLTWAGFFPRPLHFWGYPDFG